MSLERIPLFPLDMVLFPGQAVPLHIFERRYRLMTRYCMDTQSPFGLLFFHEGHLARTGCSARIVKVLKQYEDGRSDILTAGQRAFRLIRTHDEQPYFEADVEYLEEDFTGIDSRVSEQLEQLFQQFHRILYEKEDAPPFETEGSISLAYHVASELPVDVALRQELLELRSEAERQQRLVERLTEWYPQLQARERVRSKAAGNGHHKL
ncbi:MAG: LON peptidase substrate-binding domain-containing protein [Acidobacteriia bacterium]|nr:LON peptidase substrate-binding domain-containing protein [Terriglobia bacterium]